MLKQRLEPRSSLGRKFAWAAVSIAAVAAGFGFGFFDAAPLRGQSPTPAAAPATSFEVASIKPNHSGDMRIGIMFQPGRFTTTGATAKQLIALAYDVRDFQVTGGPSWIGSDKFDIDAKEPYHAAHALRGAGPGPVRRRPADIPTIGHQNDRHASKHAARRAGIERRQFRVRFVEEFGERAGLPEPAGA